MGALKSKPSWDDAPEWANFLAMDSSGKWYWYENKPHEAGDKFFSPEGIFEPAKPNYSGWRETLEERPE